MNHSVWILLPVNNFGAFNCFARNDGVTHLYFELTLGHEGARVTAYHLMARWQSVGEYTPRRLKSAKWRRQV